MRVSKARHASQGQRECQRGQASIVVLVLFLAAAAAISAIGTTEHTGNAGRTQLLNRQITDTLSRLSAWYERDGMASLGATTPDEPALQALLSTQYPALHLAMSTPIVRSGCTTVQDCEPSRQILVWYPATSTQASAPLVNGLPMYQTGGDALWRLYDSKGVVQQRMANGYNQLLSVSRALSAWVTAQKRAAVYSQTNYLRANNCSTPGAALPCLTGWTAITAVPAALEAAGMTDQDATAPWGAVIEISNASPDASQVAPYTLAMRLRTPSGAYMTHSISQ
jgi:hypothetical protein